MLSFCVSFLKKLSSQLVEHNISIKLQYSYWKSLVFAPFIRVSLHFMLGLARVVQVITPGDKDVFSFIKAELTWL